MSKILVFCFLSLFVFNSCQRKNYNREFIEAYGDENFEEHINTISYFRSLDEKGNSIYFFSFLSDTCEAPYIVTVDREAQSPVKVDLKLRKSCEATADTVGIKNLIERFLKYKVNLLKVDKDSVVYVNIDRSEEADLIKLPKSVPLDPFKGFENVEGNWYSKK